MDKGVSKLCYNTPPCSYNGYEQTWKHTSEHEHKLLKLTQGLGRNIHDLISQVKETDRFDGLSKEIG